MGGRLYDIRGWKGHAPPHEDSGISQSLVEELPATRSGRSQLWEIVINHQLSFPECFVSCNEGEELVGTTEGNRILCFTEG